MIESHRTYARLCQSIYPGGGSEPQVSIGDTHFSVFPRVKKGSIVVFRGSASIGDWIKDLEFRFQVGMIDGVSMRIHRGFLSDYDQARGALWKVAEPVIWAGHSKGGADAMLAAFLSRMETDAVVTFGCPRVGDKAFAAAYRDKLGSVTTRYHHKLDPVPFMPGLLYGYRHPVRSKWFDGTSWWDGLRWLDAIKLFFADKQEVLTDHGIGNYIKALETERV